MDDFELPRECQYCEHCTIIGGDVICYKGHTGVMYCGGKDFELDSRIAKLVHPESENPPLTVEQLKQMDGKPVYIIHPYDHRYDHWGVVVIKVKFFPDKEWTFKDYGSLWFAYVREPDPH